MTWICYVGIEVSANTAEDPARRIEIVMLVVFAIVAPDQGRTPATRPTRSHPEPRAGSTRSHLSSAARHRGVLLVVFIYWGWDTAVP